MTTSGISFSGQSGTLPDEVRSAFLEILYHTLLHVRSYANKQAVCFALADHAHNIPHFIGSPKPELLRFYWEVERPCFLGKMQELAESVSIFEPAWQIIQQEYERVKSQPVA
jgi:hypothetical protein